MPFKPSTLRFDSPNPYNNIFTAPASVSVMCGAGWYPDNTYSGMGEVSMDCIVHRLYKDGSIYGTQTYNNGSYWTADWGNLPAGSYEASFEATKNGESTGEVFASSVWGGQFGIFVVNAPQQLPAQEIDTDFTVLDELPSKPVFYGQVTTNWQNVDSCGVEVGVNGANFIEVLSGDARHYPDECFIDYRGFAWKNGVKIYGAIKTFVHTNLE